MGAWAALGLGVGQALGSKGEENNYEGGWGAASRLYDMAGIYGPGVWNWGETAGAKEKRLRDAEATRMKAQRDQLISQLTDAANGKGVSEAQQLAESQIQQNQRALLGGAVSAEGTSNPGAALRGAQQANENTALQGAQQVSALRAHEMAAARQLLAQVLSQGLDANQAMSMFKAEQEAKKEQLRKQAMSQMVGAGLAAYSAYQGAQGQSSSDYAAQQNANNPNAGVNWFATDQGANTNWGGTGQQGAPANNTSASGDEWGWT